MKKRLFALVMALMMVLVACTNGEDVTGNEEEKTINVGIIQYSEHVALDRAREGFLDQLENLGYTVNADVVNVQQDMTLIPTTAAQFQGNNVDLIYAIATPAAQGMKSSVQDIPIIFNAVTDPEGSELTGDNITGVSDYYPIENQVKSFLEIFPEVETIGVLYSLGEANSEAQIEELRVVCEDLGINLEETAVNTTNDVPQSMASLVGQIDAFMMITDNLAASAAPVIANNLNEANIPSFSGEPGPVESGILLSDGIDYYKLGLEAGLMADQIMSGTSPGDIDIYFEDSGTRTVNKTTAEILGIPEDSPIFTDANIVE